MVPMDESNLAAEGWSQVEWDHYELWDQVEQRLRRQRYLWIFATTLVFIFLSAIPIVQDRWPKWATRSLSRQLAQEMNWVKSEASTHRGAYRFRFKEPGSLHFEVERLSSCKVLGGEVVRTGSLARAGDGRYIWMPTALGLTQGIPGLVAEFCYDSLEGSPVSPQAGSLSGFGIISVRDLADKRYDRMSILLFAGTLAEISFD